jgi:hypothetical protein
VRQKLCRRLEELEKTSAVAAAVRARSNAINRQALDELWAKVKAWHAVPENQQWIAAQPPEFLGIRVRELKERLREIANGHRRAV